jgi:sugar-specific transcriptional regulator TrmB
MAVDRLVEFGMTKSQAKIYLALLVRGPLAAREISSLTGMHTVDVYRNLAELVSRGLVDIYQGSPRKFAAQEPGSALEALVRLEEERVSLLKSSLAELSARLSQLASSAPPRLAAEAQGGLLGIYRYGNGWSKYKGLVFGMVKESRGELKCITTAKGMIRGYIHGLHDLLHEASRRGIRIRIVTTVTAENAPYVRRLLDAAEIRHAEQIDFRLLISDRRATLFSTEFDEHAISSPRTSNYFLFHDQQISNLFSLLYDHFWQNAIGCERRLRELS